MYFVVKKEKICHLNLIFDKICSYIEHIKLKSKSALGKWTLNAISAIYNAKHYVTQMAKPSLITTRVIQSAKSVFVFVKGKGKVRILAKVLEDPHDVASLLVHLVLREAFIQDAVA